MFCCVRGGDQPISRRVSQICALEWKDHFHSGSPRLQRARAMRVSSVWNSETVGISIKLWCNRLYTWTIPKIERSCSAWRVVQLSKWLSSCLLCQCEPRGENGRNWANAGWPIPKTRLCKNPRMPMSRLSAGGAKLWYRNAVSSLLWISSRNEVCTLSSFASTVSQAWKIAPLNAMQCPN